MASVDHGRVAGGAFERCPTPRALRGRPGGPMPNPFIPRPTVHEWSERIGDDPLQHQASLSRLLKEQRRLSKFIDENRASMQPATAGVALYLVGVVIRMYELAGGRMKTATWE